MNRNDLFAAIRPFAPDSRFSAEDVAVIDAMADRWGVRRLDQRRMSDAGRKALIGFEGLRLTAYPDPATGGEPWTIGVGSTGPDVHKGMTITEAQADARLQADLAKFEQGVQKLAPVTTQGQFDALVSFAFNVGLGNLGSSTLLKKHNARDYDGAAGQFALWDKAAGKVMPGLTKRRAAEARMYKGLPV